MYISGRRPGPQVLPFFSTYTAYLCFGQVVASGTYKKFACECPWHCSIHTLPSASATLIGTVVHGLPGSCIGLSRVLVKSLDVLVLGRPHTLAAPVAHIYKLSEQVERSFCACWIVIRTVSLCRCTPCVLNSNLKTTDSKDYIQEPGESKHGPILHLPVRDMAVWQYGKDFSANLSPLVSK